MVESEQKAEKRGDGENTLAALLARQDLQPGCVITEESEHAESTHTP